MKPPVKTERIWHILRQRIRDEVYKTETMLPGEVKLMQEFGVSRNTIRAALKHLSEENLIRRVRGLGTVVNFQSNIYRPVVSLLLPCPDYMSKVGSMWFELRDLIEGTLSNAQKYDIGLELLSVSTTNNLENIDFRALHHLDSKSLVIIPSEWYRPIFRFLSKSNARCLLINNRNFRNENYCKNALAFPQKFQLLTKDVKMLFEQAVLYLYNAGCHKIALYAPLKKRHNAIGEGYLSGINYTTKNSPCVMSAENVPTFPLLTKHLQCWQEREQFDALIFCAGNHKDNSEAQIFNHQTLGMPSSVKIVIAYQVPYQAVTHPQLPAIYFDYAMIGRKCVEMMLYPERVPHNMIWQPAWKFPC